MTTFAARKQRRKSKLMQFRLQDTKQRLFDFKR